MKVISESDEEISDAFNKGIKIISGTLIGLINSDYRLVKGALKLINRTYLKTDADIIYGDTVVVDKKMV